MVQPSFHQNLQDDQRPYVPKGSHPIETGRYLIATNEIERMYQIISQWIENRSPGGIIHGPPRIGKTRAINYLMHILPTEFGIKMPIFNICCRSYRLPNESVFFEDLLRGVGHGIIHTGKASIKRERLFKFLLQKGITSEQNRIIFFMDDAQNLTETHYNWLMDLYNELDDAGISLTVMLVGQEELLHRRLAFSQAKKAQIIGRFMIHEHKFEGVKTLKDLKVCLACYDTESEYPENSNWSFTRFFFPDQFVQGARLEQCAEDLYEVVWRLRKENGLKGSIEIPMQYVTSTIQYALRHFGVNGLHVEWLTQANWKEAIEQSGYITAEFYQ
ncbi:ATP-binding protein [Aneurinibacillus uraniidurans]|uniref:ATP-binding protein n=1 Tax=Aneurinibacillus uraniidurans TaxID=2966586 RepID=UPI00234A69EF|nr:ATP-binding protein [Aneurinibacillus sp. B1]WCN36213.1 ATP-binding protein [Aneurinibacillus sp. B1]